MASSEQFDLCFCEVCLDNMLDKQPRMLLCHHSFCTDCLNKLIKESSILCPTCRENTPVLNNDVNSLKINFMLQKFKNYLDRIHTNKDLMCQLCLAEKASLKCQECIQLLCEDCSLKHCKVKIFSDHKIYKLCSIHKEGMITYLCIKCVKPACSKCVMMEHLDHEADIKPFEEGKKTVELSIKQYESDTNILLQSLIQARDTYEKNLKSTEEAIGDIEAIRTYYVEKQKEAEQLLKTLEDSKQNCEQGCEKCKTQIMACSELQSIVNTTINEVKNSTFDNCATLQDKIKVKLYRMKQTVPMCIRKHDTILDPRTTKEIFIETFMIPNTELVQTAQFPDYEWNIPLNISTYEDCVLISDWDKNLFCGYNTCKPPVAIPVLQGNLRDACVFQNDLYIAYDTFVTKRPFHERNANNDLKFKADIEDIYSILVLSERQIVLLSRSEKKIVNFDPRTQTTTELVTGLEDPVALRKIEIEKQLRYLVSIQGSKHNVNVYNDQWMLLFTFGDRHLYQPVGTTCTEEGIIVANQSCSKISHFSFEGEFIGDILSAEDGLHKPLGVAYVKPYLWVTGHLPGSVKCFRSRESLC